MTSRALPLSLVLALAGCFSSTTPAGELSGEAEPLVVDECVATAFAWHDDEAPRDTERALLFANYPLFSPDYELELYGAEIWVAVDERFDARYGTSFGLPGLEDVVFGRSHGEEIWRVLEAPDDVCPPRPEGLDWPTSS